MINCRSCNAKIKNVFIDLGYSPPSNSYLEKEELKIPETYYPLKTYVCNKCWLVQTEDYQKGQDLFNKNYPYFSSTSTSWLLHASNFVKKIIKTKKLNKESFVVEIASNDGYLLKNFIDQKIPCLGVEPTKSTYDEAVKIGIKCINEFLDVNLAKLIVKQYKKADLVIANNVIAHVPDINNFIKSLKILIKHNGIITIEFHYLVNMLKFYQFDTIYHEHFSYLSLTSLSYILKKLQLKLIKVEKLKTHGGSLRVYITNENNNLKIENSVLKMFKYETDLGIKLLKTYKDFKNEVSLIRYKFKNLLSKIKISNKTIIGFGAAAKGNTLLNYCGIDHNDIEFICDNAKFKQGKILPGNHIPVKSPKKIKDVKADYIVIFPWNLKDEIKKELVDIVPKKCKFVYLNNGKIKIE